MNTNPAALPSGLLLVDKPAGITSFDVIRALRRQLGVRKLGHAGTLDPFATGLLLILIEAATKQAAALIGLPKVYEAELTLGATSTTGDLTGPLTLSAPHHPTTQEVQAALVAHTGTITQVPNQFAAIKIGGVRAYQLARQGHSVTMPARQVTVFQLELLSYTYPHLSLRAHVSSGTYIRSLGPDIGTYLGTGAYVSTLRRLQVGEYQVSAASSLADLTLEHAATSVIKL